MPNINKIQIGGETYNIGVLSEFIEAFFPVGKHYFQFNGEPTPAALLPGTSWEIDTDYQGKTIVGSGGSYTLGATGGEETHTLTVAEIPSHKHNQTGADNEYGGYSSVYKSNAVGSGSEYGILLPTGQTVSDGAYYMDTNATGGSQSHNNMPPYTVINVWKRTA